jgi:hypothetical protein
MGAITRALGLSDKGGTAQAAPIVEARAAAVDDSAKIKADDLRAKAEASAALATAANDRAAAAKKARRANSLLTGVGESSGAVQSPSAGRTTLGV